MPEITQDVAGKAADIQRRLAQHVERVRDGGDRVAPVTAPAELRSMLERHANG